MSTVGGKAVSMKNSAMSSSSRPDRRTPCACSTARPGAADLLVVGDRRAGPLVVDDEPEVGLVEAHPQRDRRDERLHLVGDERVLEGLALLGAERSALYGRASMPCARRYVATRCVSATVRQ